ncbi:hypothetical protein IAE22_34025, partial [Bacillus sp. S34]|nr:hypothetical protein [Bacillus sp. S34]
MLAAVSLSALVLSVGTTLAGPSPADAAGACTPVPQPTIPEGLPYRTDFGTPQQIYNDPANLFVASFIGS